MGVKKSFEVMKQSISNSTSLRRKGLGWNRENTGGKGLSYGWCSSSSSTLSIPPSLLESIFR